MSIESVMPSTISSCVIPFSSRLQSFPESGSFPMSRLFTSGGQSIGVSASVSVLPMHESFPGMSCSQNCLFLPKCNPLVLKYRFYYYLGPAKPADEATMALKRRSLFLKVPKRRGEHTAPRRATRGAPGSIRRWKEWREK